MTLTRSQALALDAFRTFLESDADCFLLKGSAGTGKTTLIRAMVEHIGQVRRICCALAPTGRAARILRSKLEPHAAGTVHGEIYTLDQVQVWEGATDRNDPGLRFVFPLKSCDPSDMVFIVDEASMVGDKATRQDVYQFGSGRLLADLVEYARMAREGRDGDRRAKLVLVGDPAQLPPVGDNQSPALSAAYIERSFGLRCQEFELTEVMRQADGSAVLDRATALRDAIAHRDYNSFGLQEAPGEIAHVALNAALGHVVQGLRSGTGSVLITCTNAGALELNRAVRARLWGHGAPTPQVGDVLLVNKNSPLSGLMNGDLVEIVRVSPVQELRHVPIRGIDGPVPLAFRKVTVLYRSADGARGETDLLILENLLDSRERELSSPEMRALLVDFRQRHPELRPGTAEFRLALRKDSYFNALQVKYGYALTCHKAQGGEWDTVVVDFSDAGREHRSEPFFRWAYTAITRARRQLLLIGPPAFKAVSGLRFDAAAPQPAALAAAAAPAAGEPCADPDWGRYSFHAGQAPLFSHHCRVREALAAAGVRILRLQHGQYFERYALEREGAQAAVQYYYKADLRVSRVVAAPGIPSDPALLQACLARMNQVLLSPASAAAVTTAQGSEDDVAFFAEFQQQLQRALAGTDLRIAGAEPGSYRLRLSFEGEGRRGRIDFHHDARRRWTRATEVGTPGSSQGIYQQINQLLALAR